MAATKRNPKLKTDALADFRQNILSWYDRHRRDLPWRAKAGRIADPYHVWLSEIMLQQTTVTAVMPYYTKFLEKWPSVHDLAAAPSEEVMSAWAGLGYYARARNLLACAKMVSGELKGIFPDEQAALQKLPGIGDYTSAAIRTIAFNKPAAVMDGNIERIMARVFAVTDPLPGVKPYLKFLTEQVFADYEDRPGDLAQALMDLGATVCIPAKPRCVLCPVQDSCMARAKNIQDSLPARSPKKAKPQRSGEVYWITDAKGRVLIEQRPAKGLLGGMAGLPTSEWIETGKIKKPDVFAKIDFVNSGSKKTIVRHVFTHFDLTLTLKAGCAPRGFKAPENFMWRDREALERTGFPSVFKKAFKIFSTKDILI